MRAPTSGMWVQRRQLATIVVMYDVLRVTI